MKLNNIVFPLLAGSLVLAGCYDEKMDWHTPEGQLPVTSGDIPLTLQEEIDSYDNLKNYMEQYLPGVPIGVGLGADKYLDEEETAYRAVCDDNFHQFVTGNAMKMDAMVTASGNLNFSTIDAFLAEVPADKQVFGHNFIWHTQQNQTYLKSLIAPEMVIEADGDVANMLAGDDSDFNGGTSGGWGSWGSNKASQEVVEGAGEDGSACMVLANNGDGNSWEAQFAYTFDNFLEMNKTYVIKFKAKSTSSAGQLQFQYQNSNTYGSQGGYNTFTIGTEWAEYQHEFSITEYDDVNRIILNFGAVGATYYIDDIEFGEKIEIANLLAGDASDFNEGTLGGWGSWGSNKADQRVEEGAGEDGSACMVLESSADGNAWEAQCAYTFDYYLDATATYIIKFKAKSTSSAGQLQFQYQNGTSYGSQGGYNTFSIGTEWAEYQYEFTPAYEDVDRIILNFGAVGGAYYIDDILFGISTSDASASQIRKKRATTITYIVKSEQEKREALLGAMESWIGGMLQHISGDNRFVGWDVINEPITDDGHFRGIDNRFGGTWTDDNDVTQYDSAPVETTTDGLELNWGSGHFYWGYYLGMDYAVRAFELARQYAPQQVKLYVNDYGLEVNPNKLDKLIEFVRYIDEHSTTTVDGIGTQMHVNINYITKDQVDQMFQKLAATGKLIRVSELDVALETASPSAEQLQTQSDIYQMIIESYKANIPAEQRGGFVIWGVSDAADEHVYWIPNDGPNLFDASYKRKVAYKGLCDGIAGQDLGASFNGDMWKDLVETEEEDTDTTEDAAE